MERKFDYVERTVTFLFNGIISHCVKGLMSILTYFSGMLLFTFIFYAVTITGMGLMYNYYGKSELVSALVWVISCMSLYIISMMLLSIWLK